MTIGITLGRKKKRTQQPVLNLLTNKSLLRDERIEAVDAWVVFSDKPKKR